MNKRFRSILCSLLALIMLLTLLPMTVAAADPKVEAYKAYTAFLQTRISEITTKIWGNSFYDEFYNMVPSNNRDGKLVAVKNITFEEVTNDGIKDMFVDLEIQYDGSKQQILSYIYTYENGQIKEIGCFHEGKKQNADGSWSTMYPDNFIWDFGSLHHSTGPDGKNYLCTINPNGYDFSSIPCYFYGYNGTQMVQVGEFRETFVPDWEIGNIQSQYGKYIYSYNDKTVSKTVYDNALNKLRSGGSHKVEFITAEAALEWLKLESDNPFTDVANGDWFAKPVLWAVDNNVTGGIGNGMFGPNNPCTRAQVVTFLWAANGKPEPTSSNNPFSDVPGDAWYLKPVLWAVERGITGGTSPTTFSPDQECTRAQIVTFLYAAAGKPNASGTNLFLDVSNGDWYFNPILWAYQNNITGGTSPTTFGPLDVCTRSQVVTFLYKAYDGGIVKPDIEFVPKPTITPIPTPVPVRETQVSAAQSYSAPTIPQNAVQDIVSFTNHKIQIKDAGYTNHVKYNSFDDESLNQYMDMLLKNGFTSTEPYKFTYQGKTSESWGFVYNNAAGLETIEQIYTDAPCHLYIHRSNSAGYNYGIYWSEGLNICDLGLRMNGRTVSLEPKGTSLEQALWRLSNGSYQTDDGRLTAAPGESMIIYNGKVLKGTGSTWKMSDHNSIGASANGNDSAYLGLTMSAPVNELKTNRLYLTEDMRNENAHHLSVSMGGDNYSTLDTSTALDSASVRLMYVSSEIAVLYVYAEAPGETIEALICAKR